MVMLARARDAGVPARRVSGDEADGPQSKLRTMALTLHVRKDRS